MKSRISICVMWLVGCIFCTSLLSGQVKDLSHWQNLEEELDPCVVQTKQIKVPGYPDAFNASLLAWGEKEWLLCFRHKDKVEGVWQAKIGLVTLSEDFEVNGPVSLLDTGSHLSADPRLIEVGESIYIVYSDVSISALLAPILGAKNILEVVVGKIEEHDGLFSIHSISHLTNYPNRIPNRVEKNWVPFAYADQLLLSYSIQPHTVFRRPFENDICEIYAKSVSPLKWKWGVVRGGTPALLINGKYLSIFHSSKAMRSLHSEGKQSRHYFLGAYLFSAEPPFEIQQISPKPIIGRNFYIGKKYLSYWAPIQAVFPCGIVQRGDSLWVSYGRQDHEVWVVQINTNRLLESLVDVKQ